MKLLTIVRHAKSSWDFAELSDRERPLNKRGLRDAPAMGKRLLEAGIVPDKIVSSDAVRAWSTAEIIAAELDYPSAEIVAEPRLYHALVEELLDVIPGLGEGCEHLMIFGHNPGFTELVNHFHPGLTYNLPTAGVVSFKMNGEIGRSADVELVYYDYPKKDRA
ncbi:MAG: histidine phosphatase family protein [Verrucomicrobiales bacterium]|nr:histidine phosphatase family protein [Verrucomicrobiales bacterium]